MTLLTVEGLVMALSAFPGSFSTISVDLGLEVSQLTSKAARGELTQERFASSLTAAMLQCVELGDLDAAASRWIILMASNLHFMEGEPMKDSLSCCEKVLLKLDIEKLHRETSSMDMLSPCVMIDAVRKRN